MKRVSFEVAKAIKEAGYPQDKSEYNNGYAISKVTYKVYSSRDDTWYSNSADTGRMLTFDDDYYYPEDCGEYCVAPYYMDVWLWLWREKRIEIEILNDGVGLTSQIRIQGRPQFFNNDPEEVIIAAIDYLVNNDLI